MLTSTAVAVIPLPKVLQQGVPLSALSGSESAELVYQILVPPGAKNLKFLATGGKGDADLYVKFGSHPEKNDFDLASSSSSTAEAITIAGPEPGVWYVMVYGFEDFSGVRLTAKYDKAPNSASIPRLSPGPGDFSDKANVLMTSTAGAKIYFTIDGSEPDENSNLYRKPLPLTQTTTIKALAILRTGARSPAIEAVYNIEPSTPAIDVQSGVPVLHRGGNHADLTYFKINVPPGQLQLQVNTGGGVGATSLYARFGDIATTRLFKVTANGPGHLAQIIIKNPAPGDWYFTLRGLNNYSGADFLAKLNSGKPDLIVWADTLRPYITTQTFDPNSCEVLEGLATAGTRRLLRFTSETRNVGRSDLVVGDPIGNPAFEYAECHNHYHFRSFASYRLLNLDGSVAATGKKVSFCIEDVRKWNPSAPNRTTSFNCKSQGLHAGWADIYDSGLPGQNVDITDVPSGDYLLEVIVNPAQVLEEEDYTNNTTRVRVNIP